MKQIKDGSWRRRNLRPFVLLTSTKRSLSLINPCETIIIFPHLLVFYCTDSHCLFGFWVLDKARSTSSLLQMNHRQTPRQGGEDPLMSCISFSGYGWSRRVFTEEETSMKPPLMASGWSCSAHLTKNCSSPSARFSPSYPLSFFLIYFTILILMVI